MHANVTSDRGGGSGGGSWRLPPDETLQVSDQKENIDVSNLWKSSNKVKIVTESWRHNPIQNHIVFFIVLHFFFQNKFDLMFTV